MQEQAFITDGHWRKSLACVRALGRAGVGCTVGETTRLATAAFSRYCRRRVVYPSPVLRPQAFLAFMRGMLRRRCYRLLLPMEDDTVALLARHRDELARHTFLPVVDHATLMRARRKDRVLGIAARLGIPVPRTWCVTDLEELEALKAGLPYPLVIKPRIGSGALGVTYVNQPEALVAGYRRVHRRFAYPMIQERIPAAGAGFGASFLLDAAGRVKASFVHKRLREYPVGGGASTLRESVRHDELRDMGETLLKALNWFGVAMVEFKFDVRDGRPKLMEVNPRFWGSLALAVASGVNFPHLLYRMARGEQFASVETYRVGQRARWLLPGDLLHFIQRRDRRGLLPEFCSFRDRRTVYDIVSRSDPLPAMGRMLMPLTLLYDVDMQRRLRMRRHGC
jgi:predicted ATP-grasp superfamily ATP-dependent carboligase